MQLYFVHFKMVFLIFKMIKSKKKLRYTFGSYFIASPLYRFTFLQVHPHHIPCVVLLWLVSCSCSLFVRAILLPSSCPPSALLLLLLLLQRLCLAPFPFTGCVALATSSLPGRKKIKKKSEQQNHFSAFSVEFIQLAPPAEISTSFPASWPGRANFCVLTTKA